MGWRGRNGMEMKKWDGEEEGTYPAPVFGEVTHPHVHGDLAQARLLRLRERLHARPAAPVLQGLVVSPYQRTGRGAGGVGWGRGGAPPPRPSLPRIPTLVHVRTLVRVVVQLAVVAHLPFPLFLPVPLRVRLHVVPPVWWGRWRPPVSVHGVSFFLNVFSAPTIFTSRPVSNGH